MSAGSQTESSAADPKKIRVLIADDHVIVLEGLAAIIGRQPDMMVAAEAADGQEAVKLWIKHHPDVTLLDLRMPKLDGVSAIERIREQDTSAHVILLTTYEADTEILRAIRAGTNAYLSKGLRCEELLDCIRRVNRGKTCIPASLVEKVSAGLSCESLSSRELNVLELLGRGKSNKEIGVSLYIKETTVESYLRNIFRKLNVFNRTEAITVASRRRLIRL
jgi:DNA-binding NarL/FixJ family response regulator